MLTAEAKHIHFIGIGGIGTSSLAQILHYQGKKISGSDAIPTDITKNLARKGIRIYNSHDSKNIQKKHQLVIYSPAIPADNPELKQAEKYGIQCLSYPKALGQLTQDHYTVAITGTHGKSTTTAMLALIATRAGLDPTVVIGTKIKEFGNKNFRLGKGNCLIIEACEYKESFLQFDPNVLIITNIEAEHLDYFKNFKNYKAAFEKLVRKLPKDGALIINSEDRHSRQLKKISQAQVLESDSIDFPLKPGIIGKFNITNAKLAATAAILLNIQQTTIQGSIKSYKGSWRRLEYKRKKLGRCRFIDDYAHHPTEIQETLLAIREMHPKSKILCVFQPHQYSRTHTLLKEFGESFTEVDQVVIPNIYKVRDSEKDTKKISTDDLVSEINKHIGKALNGNGLIETAKYIKKNHSKFDIIVTMGAGDIGDIYKLF